LVVVQAVAVVLVVLPSPDTLLVVAVAERVVTVMLQRFLYCPVKLFLSTLVLLAARVAQRTVYMGAVVMEERVHRQA
jgi:hypothetical protein